jgi:hypothetical protein
MDGKFSLAKHLLDRMVPGWRENGLEQKSDATATPS